MTGPRRAAPAAARPADGGLPHHRPGRPATGQAGALDPGRGHLPGLDRGDAGGVERADRCGAAAARLGGHARLRRRSLGVDPGRRLPCRARDPGRPADRLPADRRHDDRPAGPRLLDRLHEPRPRVLAVLRVPEPVHVLDAAARPRRQLAGRVRGMGAGRPVELPAHRLLVPQAERGSRRQEGVHRQPGRRRRVRARDHGHLPEHRHAERSRVDRDPDQPDPRRLPDPGPDRRAAGLRGRHGQERPVPAPRLAAGRDGRPDPGVGAHPRGHDGQRRRLPRGPCQPAVRGRAVHDGRRRGDRHLHRHPGRVDRDDPDRHQAGARVLDAIPARLHVRGARGGGVHRGDLPPHDPRLLQGPAVPRIGLGHPRRPRGAGHAPDGRAGAQDPDHLRDDARRLGRHRRDPAAGRLLLEGRDPRRGLQVRLPAGSGRSASSWRC